MIELAASYRRYNCCIERFVVIGRPSREQLNLHALVEETLSTMLADHDKGLAMGLGNTVLVTEKGAESLTRLPLALMTKH